MPCKHNHIELPFALLMALYGAPVEDPGFTLSFLTCEKCGDMRMKHKHFKQMKEFRDRLDMDCGRCAKKVPMDEMSIWNDRVMHLKCRAKGIEELKAKIAEVNKAGVAAEEPPKPKGKKPKKPKKTKNKKKQGAKK